MKKYAIILDEENEIRVIPNKWLTDDKKTMFWPPLTKKNETTDAVMKLKDVSIEWKKYPVTKYIKSNDNYVAAVTESKMPNLQDLTDASDDDKLKRSRASRHKKAKADDEPPNKTRKITNDSDESEDVNKESPEKESSGSEDKSDDEETVIVPDTVNVAGKKKSTSVDNTNKSSIEFKNLEKDNDLRQQEPHLINPNNKQSVIKPISIQDMTDREIIMATYGLVTKLVEKTNSYGIKIGNLESKIGSVQRTSDPDTIILTEADIVMLNKYFPIDNKNSDNNKKTITVVEGKLSERDKVFFQKVVSFLKSKGGNDHKQLIYNMMSTLMRNEVANEYSFTGRKTGMKAFKNSILCSCVYQACKKVFFSTPDDHIARAITLWLDASNTRTKREANGQSKGSKIFTPISMIPEDDSDS